MSSFGTYVLIHVFAAFLPPKSPDDRDFYDVLGVPRTASEEDIRKAYKKASLALHPDKVSQFGRVDPQEAARLYEQVQAAYTVLSSSKKRQLYQACGCSPTRYHYIDTGAYQNPTDLLENLAHASAWTKLRLVTIVGIIIGLVLLQPILIASKLNQSLAMNGGGLEKTKWTVILIPLWIFHGLLVLLFLLSTVIAPAEVQLSVLLTTLSQATWLVAEIVLALRWDRTLTNHFSIIFIPVYIVMFLRCFQAIDSARQVGKDIQRMVSSNYMMEKVLNGRDLDELTDEERQEIYKKYIIVHVPPDVEVEAETEAAVEQGRVESSPEFERAQEVMGQSIAAFWNTVVFGVTFVALVVSKLDEKIDVSWWGVFSPIWIYFGSQLVYNGYTCCCGSVAGQEIILQMNAPSNNESEANQGSEGDGKEKPKDSNTDGSSLFVAPEGNTEDFNHTKANLNAKANVNAGTETTTELKSEAVEVDIAVSDSDVGKVQVPETAVMESTEAAPATAPENTSTPKGDGKNHGDAAAPDNHEDEHPHIHIDEETFRAWQSAYAEAEQSAQQEQARATLNCATVAFQTLMLCLVVGKLENDYKKHPPQGYNAMWVLFPVFFFFGLCFCFCVCAICGAAVPDDSEDEQQAQPAVPSEVENKDSKAEQGLVQQSPEVVAQTPELLISAQSTNTAEHTDVPSSEPINEMADLD